jgi:hypothetical protein
MLFGLAMQAMIKRTRTPVPEFVGWANLPIVASIGLAIPASGAPLGLLWSYLVISGDRNYKPEESI